MIFAVEDTVGHHSKMEDVSVQTDNYGHRTKTRGIDERDYRELLNQLQYSNDFLYLLFKAEVDRKGSFPRCHMCYLLQYCISSLTSIIIIIIIIILCAESVPMDVNGILC